MLVDTATIRDLNFKQKPIRFKPLKCNRDGLSFIFSVFNSASSYICVRYVGKGFAEVRLPYEAKLSGLLSGNCFRKMLLQPVSSSDHGMWPKLLRWTKHTKCHPDLGIKAARKTVSPPIIP